MSAKKHNFLALFGLTLAIAAIPALSAELMSDEELSEVRGGFTAGDFDFGSFGATLSTTIDGNFIYGSTLTLNDQGLTVNQKLGESANIIPLDQAASAGLQLGKVQGEGVVVLGSGGATAVVQTLSDSAVRNLVVNTAQNRTILEETSLTFVIPNLPNVQQQAHLQTLTSNLEDAINSGLLAALRH